MLGVGPATRIYLAAGATDMRKSFEGRYGLVRDRLSCDPLSGHVFLFSNAQRNRLKLLFLGWQRALDLRQAPGGQNTHGNEPTRCYHDKEFAAKMKEIGLQPSNTGEPGGPGRREVAADSTRWTR
jgi:IS66 Orf2 like protein